MYAYLLQSTHPVADGQGRTPSAGAPKVAGVLMQMHAPKASLNSVVLVLAHVVHVYVPAAMVPVQPFFAHPGKSFWHFVRLLLLE